MKPNYPVIIIYARDWGMDTVLMTKKEVKRLKVPQGWLVGWLVDETKEAIKLAHEYFDDSDEYEFRYVSTIPKETIIYKKIISEGDI